jgi:hypothetical protein
MSNACEEINGTSFGSNLEHCAVQGYTQLSTIFPGDASYQGFAGCDRASPFNGVGFGSSFCAAKGEWSTINTKIAGSGSWNGQVTSDTCDRVQGRGFDRFCWTRQAVGQLSTRLPGDTSWAVISDSLCDVGFGDECVAVSEPSQQRVQLLYARTVDGFVNTNIRSLCSDLLGGTPVSDSGCAIVSTVATSGGLAASPNSEERKLAQLGACRSRHRHRLALHPRQPLIREARRTIPISNLLSFLSFLTRP